MPETRLPDSERVGQLLRLDHSLECGSISEAALFSEIAATDTLS